MVGLLALLNIVLLLAHRRMAGRLRRLSQLLRLTDRGSLDELVNTFALNIEEINRKLDGVAAWQRAADETLAGCARTPVMLRFCAFEGVGGDLSYSCAILDGKGDGVILTALHSQNASFSYGKPVEGGRSAYQFSTEEQEAVGRAMKNAPPGDG
jgi:hypothetical protein